MWNYYRDGMNNYANENNADIYQTDDSIARTSKPFEYKMKIKLAS